MTVSVLLTTKFSAWCLKQKLRLLDELKKE